MRFGPILLSALLALAGVFQPNDAKAAAAGTGSFTATADTTVSPPYPITGVVTWSDATRNVFGRTVNLGTSVGTMPFTGTLLPPSSFSGTASDPPVLTYDIVNGAYLPNAVMPPYTSGSSFVSDAVGLTGDAVGSDSTDLPDGLTFAYTQDGASSCTTVSGIMNCAGIVALNAFESQPTPSGSLVTTTVPTTFFNPISGIEVPVTVDVTFYMVSSPGDTQVKTTSFAAGVIPYNFAIQVGSWRAAFVDVTTTAEGSPPMRTCITYPDSVPPDGVVDGTGIATGIAECDMRLLHKENGDFIDVTMEAGFIGCPTLAGTCGGSSPRCIDTVSNKICGLTYSLSPFVVAAPSQLQVPALSPRGVLVLGATLALAGAALLGVPRWYHRKAST